MIVNKIVGNRVHLDLTDKVLHYVEFTDVEMEKGHQRFKTIDGMEVGLSLDEGVHMESGDVLYMDETDAVIVEASAQKVFVLYPVTCKEWGKVCYNIGNMHQKAYLTEHEVLVPYDYVLEGMISKLEVKYEVDTRKILGEKANISAKVHKGGGHHHHH